jgi:DNA-directed RNA polymerase subunit RPC12/RpoP
VQRETVYDWVLPVKDQKLVVALVSNLENEPLTPTRDSIGKLRYQRAEDILGEEPEKTREILDLMVEKEILERTVFYKDIECPSCRSSNISTVYRCTTCMSINISKNALIEHVSCGNIGPRDNYLSSNNQMVCPNCHLELSSGSWKNIGSWYECSDCNRRISIPDPQHICRNCSTEFLFENARYENVYSYSLRKGIADQYLKLSNTYQAFKEVLEQKGYGDAETTSMKGESGVMHEFDLLASRDGQLVAVEVAIGDGGVDQTRIVQWFAKIIDTRVTAYFVAIPSLDAGAAKLASAYKLNIIEAETPANGASKLKEVLG